MLNFSFWTSFFLGLLDGLSPGHGKSVMASMTLSGGFRIKALFMMIGSLLITHFLLLLVLAWVLQTYFSGQAYIEWMEWIGPIVVTLFGLYLLYSRYKSNAKTRTETFGNITEVEHLHGPECGCVNHSVLNPKPQDGMLRKATFTGMLLGLVPCPIAISTIFLSMATDHFGSAVLMISVYMMGMTVVMLTLGGLTWLGSAKASTQLNDFSGRFDIRLLSALLITGLGVVYLVMQSMHIHVHG
jgi:ABC-type nickel/cobalt efflux system permease component RcnA